MVTKVNIYLQIMAHLHGGACICGKMCATLLAYSWKHCDGAKTNVKYNVCNTRSTQ